VLPRAASDGRPPVPVHELAAVGGVEHLDHFEQGRIV